MTWKRRALLLAAVTTGWALAATGLLIAAEHAADRLAAGLDDYIPALPKGTP